MGSLPRFRVNRPTVVYEIIDDEVIIIEFDSGNYYSLDKTGAHMWRLIERGATQGEIEVGTARLYGGPPEVIKEAVERLLAELRRESLIVPDESGGNDEGRGAGAPTEPDLLAERPIFEPPVLQKYTDMQELLMLDPIHEVDVTGWPAIPTDRPGSGEQT
jgi:hypothetical protein